MGGTVAWGVVCRSAASFFSQESLPPRIGRSGTWQPAARVSVALQPRQPVATTRKTTLRQRYATNGRNTRRCSDSERTLVRKECFHGRSPGRTLSMAVVRAAMFDLVNEIVIW